MKSPFPGMDPWLEGRWSDVHAGLVVAIRTALQPLLPTDLRARAEERVLLETGDREFLATYRGDVAVVEKDRDPPDSVAEGPGTVEPVLIEIRIAPEVERWVQIVDVRGGNRVVTAIEVLSPWNKRPGSLNASYRKKVYDYARAGVNLVEIDLLRESRAHLEVGQPDLPPDRRAPYLASLRRAARPSRWEVYPMPLREPLPAVPVPLREYESDLLLPLQPLVDQVYREGGHDDLPYGEPPAPPLAPEDAAWADELLRAAGRR